MRIHIITGQTATGKTSYAITLAQQLNGELINCDSRQIYAHLDIITGKDLTNKTFHPVQKKDKFQIGYYELYSEEKTPVKIWLYDVVDPKIYFSSFDYQTCALETIKDIISRGKTPIIVGGTYFYLKHLLYEVQTENIQPNWTLRTELALKTVQELQTILKSRAPDFFQSLNQSEQNNPQRLMRKIELLDEGILENQNSNSTIILPKKIKETGINTHIEIQMIGFAYQSKDNLQTNIENRVEKRVQDGAIKEVEQLLKNGYTENDPGLRTIGYQQIIAYLRKKMTKKTALQEWITKEKQYAKRQYTFMKKDPNISWRFI